MQIQQVNKYLRLKTIVIGTGVMAGLGVTYAVVFGDAHYHAIIQGAVAGLVIGLVVSIGEVYFFQTRGQRLRFSMLLGLRTLFYVVVISGIVVIVIALHQAYMESTSLTEALTSETFHTFLVSGEFLRIFFYALTTSLAINFVRQISRLLGPKVLLNYLTGRYHRPVEEARIFMFLDIKSSTAIAERLGNKLYHSFLNDFFFDISSPIVESRGRIYQYVGDEVVVTWTEEEGLREANCIACFFRVAATLHMHADLYERKYGFIPGFKAGYHFGHVIAGEIGDVKKDIVFHGDTVNTAARIRSECSRLGKDLLFSGDLRGKLADISGLIPESVGKIRLRGKQEEIELFTLREAA
jgi:adenylate cyclase